MPQAPSSRSLYAQYGLLLAILLVAGLLRIVYLTQAPPGLNQDEAANAYNYAVEFAAVTARFAMPIRNVLPRNKLHP